jgi:signal transduction histidine kinase/ligand-binding sensor domain-containing protein
MSSRLASQFARQFAAGCLLSALAVAVAAGIAARALEPATPLGSLGRQAWTVENGLPQNTVSVLLQSRNGFLWAGTELGLARFDGTGFRVFDHATDTAFPDAEIRCLLDASDGTLWVGTSDGLVHWQNGAATLMTVREGLPANGIIGLAQARDKSVWAWTEAGLARWDGQRFQKPEDRDFAGDDVTSIAADASGGLWVGTSHGAVVFREGKWRAMGDPGYASAAASATDGAGPESGPALVKALRGGDVLIASGGGLSMVHGGRLSPIATRAAMPVDAISFLDRLANGLVAVASKSSLVLVQNGLAAGQAATIGRFAVGRELPGSRIESVYADREGCVWVGTNRGLARIAADGAGSAAVQQMPPTDPLASKDIVSLLEDREGDMWAGTESAGLHILRDARFRMLGGSDGLSSDATTAIVQDAHAALPVVWIGTRDAGLNRVFLGAEGTRRITALTTANGLLSNVILSLAVAPDGGLWVGTPDGLNRIGNGAVTSYTSADGLPDDFVRSVLAAPDGSLWIGTRRGLTSLEHGRFLNYTVQDGLGSDLVGALALTPEGSLWIATLNGLSRLRGGKIENFTVADGLSSNVITALEASADGKVWIGTQGGGLNLWDGRRFLAVNRRGLSGPGALPAAVHAIALDGKQPDGKDVDGPGLDGREHLWLATDTGLTRLELAALQACAAKRDCDLNAAHGVSFSTADGLRSREMSGNSHPTVSRAADGTLWFTTPRGVVIVDPLHFPADPPPPPVAVERFAVDDHDMTVGQADAEARIRAGALRFQFDYAGLSFAAPQKLRYQYMLEGFDHGWTDAGARRTAYYTNIPPGSYRFRVRAALGDAAFASAADTASYAPDEASLRFVLQPRYYQTVWFRVLAGLAVAGLILLVFRRRVLRVEREFSAVMGERNRIAREIHDTLAQGYVGISLQLEILGQLLRQGRGDAAAKHLKVTQEMVREGLNDARQSIWALRSQDSGEQALPIRLRRLVEQAGGGGLQAHLEVYGAYRALPGDAEQEILRIAQEAIQNVKKHAAASRLGVRLEYDSGSLTLTVADDGRGFEAGGPSSGREGVGREAMGREGHYGLTGMRERASLIHGNISIVSQPGMGATVRLRVPAPEAQ